MSTLFNNIESIFRKKLPINNSGSTVNLSLGESLLLVLNVCQKEKVDPKLLTELKRIYLEGIKTSEEKEFVKEIRQVFLDKNFNVKSDPKTVSEDPTRRYFETNLAYHILQKNAESLDTAQLEEFTNNLKKRLFSLPDLKPEEQKKIEKVLAGNMDEKLLNKYELEYAELIHKLLNQNYHGLSPQACKNLYYIACNTILATMNTQVDHSMPMDIYSDSIFTMGMDGRGRHVKKTQEEVRTTAKGLMKSTSPLPMYHSLVNPVEKDYNHQEHSPFQRSADQAGFMIESEWSQYLFSRQVQPYSNGISSTTLAQIRNLILQKRLGNPYFSSNLQEYISVFAALMLYNSGGHSFFEIFEVLKLPLSVELLSEDFALSSALKQDSLMYKVLYVDHQEAFETALQATLDYTQTLLNKKLLNAQINPTSLSKKPVDDTALSAIHSAVLNSSAEELEQLLSSTQENINVPNDKEWSPLMVAAQLGKTDHVKVLLKAGADITKKVDDLSPLELAIKSQKFSTVEVLLQAGATGKRKQLGVNLKKRAPALFLACRQNDMNILNALLDKETWSFNDKKAAIQVALKIENLSAVKLLIGHITSEEKKLLSDEYQFSLLQIAVSLGNVSLIDEVMKLDIPTSVEIDYNNLLEISVHSGFLPTTKHLLDLANKTQDAQPSVDLNAALRLALENHHFDVAMILIIYGAEPNSIPASSNYLVPFNSYLRKTEHFDFSFMKEEVEKIQTRSKAIEHSYNDLQKSIPHKILTNIVEFLNRILPTTMKLGYNDKTKVIESTARFFSNKEQTIPQSSSSGCGAYKIGLFGSNHQNSNSENMEGYSSTKPR